MITLTSTIIIGFIGNWLSWAIFGLVAGALAKWIMPGKDPGGFLVTMLIGIIGAVVGGWISTMLLDYNPNNWSLGGFGVAILGALLLLFLWKKVFSEMVNK